jgi:hypothetical protein
MVNKNKKKEKCIRITNADIEKVNQFKNLGSNITDNNNISTPINHRNHTGTNDIMDCEIYRVSKLLQKCAKCNIYKTLFRTAVLYRCQSWTVTNIDGGKLSISERKVLRKIYSQVVSMGYGE